jgi:serine phosphatase RsbU (regulator of sigma subunit)
MGGRCRCGAWESSFSPQDLFLMMTDGISEVPNASDEEFGLDRLELLLKNNGGRPLPQLWELIMDEVACWVSTSTSV